MPFVRAALGLVFFCLVAWLLSSHRRRFPWRVVICGLLLQFALAALILATSFGQSLFQGIAGFYAKLISSTEPGAALLFGPLANPVQMRETFGPDVAPALAFAGTGLVVIIFFSALMAILYHFGIMQLVIWAIARAMSKLMGVSGAESMSVAANIFVGNTEAPLVIRPYLPRLTSSELNALMTGGFATIAGSVLALYMGFVGEDLAPHLLTASVMSAPAAFLIAKIMLPETEEPVTGRKLELKLERTAGNVIEAATNGTRDGLQLWLNVMAMLIAFMALIAVVDWPLGWLGGELGLEGGLSLSRLFGWIFAPIAFVMGVEGWHDCQLFGSLLGIKIAVNEFVAYQEMSGILTDAQSGFENTRSAAMAAYALCGFANFASIGVQIGGISPLAPERKADISRLAFRAMLGGACATWMTATIAGVFI